MAKWLKAVHTLTEAVDGKYSEGGKYAGAAQVIGAGHVFLHHIDQRAEVLLAVGRNAKRADDNPVVVEVSPTEVLKYVDACRKRGVTPRPEVVQFAAKRGHSAAAESEPQAPAGKPGKPGKKTAKPEAGTEEDDE